MLRITLLVAVLIFLVGCGTQNPIAPTSKETTPVLNNDKTLNKAPYYEPTYIGEPHRGTDPDLGPTG